MYVFTLFIYTSVSVFLLSDTVKQRYITVVHGVINFFLMIFRCFFRLQHARQRLQEAFFVPLRRPDSSSRNLSNLLQPFFLPRDPAFRDSRDENKSLRVCASPQRLLVLEVGASARSTLRKFQSKYLARDGFAHDRRRFWWMLVFNYSAFLARDENIFQNREIVDEYSCQFLRIIFFYYDFYHYLFDFLRCICARDI